MLTKRFKSHTTLCPSFEPHPDTVFLACFLVLSLDQRFNLQDRKIYRVTFKSTNGLKVLGLLLQLAKLGRAVVLPPDAGVQVSGVSQPTHVRDSQQTRSLVDFLHGSSPVTYGTGESTDVDQSQPNVAGTKEEGRPESVEAELDPVEREGLFGDVAAETGRGAVKSANGQVRSPTHGSVEDGPNDTVVAGGGVEAGFLEGFVPDRVGRVVGRLGGEAVDDADGNGDTHRKDRVAGLSSATRGIHKQEEENEKEKVRQQDILSEKGKERERGWMKPVVYSRCQ